MAKDCFYSGLHKQYQPLVIHLKDKVHTTTSDLLRAIHVHEEVNLTCETEDTTIQPINLSTMQPTNLDRTNVASKLRGMLPRLLSCPMKNSQNRLNCQRPLT